MSHFFCTRLLTLASIVASLVLPFQCLAQDDLPTPEIIVERHIEALGGEMSVSNLESYKLVGEYSTLGEISILFHEGSLRWSTDGKSTFFGYDGNVYWNDTKLRLGKNEGYSIGFIPLPSHGLNWLEEPFVKVRNEGVEIIGDQSCFKLSFLDPGKIRIDRYFDVEGGLLVRTAVDDGLGTSYNYEYSEMGGILFATKIEGISGGSTFGVAKYRTIELDPDVTDVDFQMPESLKQQLDDELKRRQVLREKEDSATKDD